MLDYNKICLQAFQRGTYTVDMVKVFVARSKITPAQYKEITNIEYVA